ncbi:unnamed protein product [Adineta ricciae]|uniref:Uncharacterized protein n=1 Tax=Adineta ricciae TaxID=249248 RepID=A0A814IR04_ADIRI|nr:unnamed protein product [Adineta ricciae]CAF1424130.1 unnamed protein product [Adineta ricciae]
MIHLTLSNPVEGGNTYGCGPMGINIDQGLNQIDREEIIPCCVAHDICYRNCSMSRFQCDCDFYKCIKNQCENKLPHDCAVFAIKFYTLVRIGGISSYQRDQRTQRTPYRLLRVKYFLLEINYIALLSLPVFCKVTLKTYSLIVKTLSLISLASSVSIISENSLGCGPMGVNIDLALNKIDRSEIIPCCVSHDACYRNCSMSRLTCDCTFYTYIKNRCENHLPNDCKVFATNLFAMVRIEGVPSYKRDQESSKCLSKNYQRELDKILMQQETEQYVKSCPK